MREAFSQLDPRAQEIVESRWLRDDKMTLHELASRFGISAERVRQLEQNAIKKLLIKYTPKRLGLTTRHFIQIGRASCRERV